MNTKLLINTVYPELSKSEKKIADFILEDENDTIIFMTIAEISNQLGVGEATVIRFCKRIQFNGFQDFKLMIALEKEKEENLVENSLEAIIKNKMIDVLNNSHHLVNQERISEVVESICAAKNIYIFGIGSSGFVSEIFEERLMRIGVKSKSIKEGHLQIAQAAIASEDELIFVISLSGSTEDVYVAMLEAKKRKTTMIAITNHSDSPIAKLADNVLLTAGYESPLTGGDFLSMISQFFILSLICEGYIKRYEQEAYDSKTSIARVIRKKAIK